MQSAPRPEAQAVARQFVAAHFPTCLVALLGGSVAGQGGGLGADLDIVIVDPHVTPHWATHELAGWPIEIFALTPDTYRHAFTLDQRRRWPLHLNLCRTAIALTDRDGLAQTMRDEAHNWYAQGPSPLSADEIAAARYTLTWMVDDLADASDPDDLHLIGHDLAQQAVDSYLLAHQRWLGKGKWRMRQLHEANPSIARDVTQALASLREGDKRPLLQFGALTLDQLGGRGFAGRYFAYQFD